MGPAYMLRSRNAECEICMNLYTELIETQKGKDTWSLNKCPGKSSQCVPEVARVRGMAEVNGVLYAAVGVTVYRMDFTFTPVAIGTIPNGTNGAVKIAASRTQIVFIADSSAYLYDIATTAFTFINWYGAAQGVVSVGYLNTFFLFLKIEGDGFFYSNPGDANAGSALQVVVGDANANQFTTMIVDHEEVWLLGNRITQVFATTTDPNFPFVARLSDGTIEEGIDSPNSIVKAGNMLLWLGADQRGHAVVWKAEGYTPVRASNYGVENAIEQMTTTNDAVGWTYREAGHDFYVLNFITENQTWVLDILTGHWHQRASWSSTGIAGFRADRGFCATAAFNHIIVGDRTSGNIYIQSLDYNDDNGNIMKWIRQGPDGNNLGKRVSYSRLEILMQTGVGGAVSPSFDPQIMIEWSNDNGWTFGTQYMRSIGKAGEYDLQVYIAGLGDGRNRVWRISGTDAVPIHIQNMTADVAARSN